MASTGTAIFTMNRDAVISAAYRKLRVLQEGATANATQITTGAEALNVVIKWMQSQGFLLWTYAQISFPMQANKNSYTVGPVGADITSPRPLGITEGCFSRQVIAGANQDMPLTLLSRAQYLNLAAKQAQGYPNSIYYDGQFNTAGGVTSTSTGFGTLYVYVQPTDTSRTIIVNAKRQLYDMANANDEFDFPSECFRCLIWTLAEELADEEEVPLQRIDYIMKRAKMYQDQMFDSSVEMQPTRFQADTSMYYRPRR